MTRRKRNNVDPSRTILYHAKGSRLYKTYQITRIQDSSVSASKGRNDDISEKTFEICGIKCTNPQDNEMFLSHPSKREQESGMYLRLSR